jgi:hypothetical protein
VSINRIEVKAETDSHGVARMFCWLLLPCKMRGCDMAISYIYFATMEAIAVYTDKCCVFRIGGGQGQPEKSLFYQKIGPVSL